jgi:hypothetical protein
MKSIVANTKYWYRLAQSAYIWRKLDHWKKRNLRYRFDQALFVGSSDEVIEILTFHANVALRLIEGPPTLDALMRKPDVTLNHVKFMHQLLGDTVGTFSAMVHVHTPIYTACLYNQNSEIIEYILEKDPKSATLDKKSLYTLLYWCNESHAQVLDKFMDLAAPNTRNRASSQKSEEELHYGRCVRALMANVNCPKAVEKRILRDYFAQDSTTFKLHWVDKPNLLGTHAADILAAILPTVTKLFASHRDGQTTHTPEFWNRIFVNLETNRSLKVLQLEYIDMRRTRIQGSDILRLIRSNPVLEEVQVGVDTNFVGATGVTIDAVELVETLKTNTTLKKLTICMVGFGPESKSSKEDLPKLSDALSMNLRLISFRLFNWQDKGDCIWPEKGDYEKAHEIARLNRFGRAALRHPHLPVKTFVALLDRLNQKSDQSRKRMMEVTGNAADLEPIDAEEVSLLYGLLHENPQVWLRFARTSSKKAGWRKRFFCGRQ